MGVHELHSEITGQRAVEALKKNFFDAVYFNNSEDASDYIMNYIEKDSKVGFGGSQTVKGMGIQEKVRAKGGIVLDHGEPNQTMEEKMEIMRGELLSDVFICSSNAVTLNGELVNIDGTGNRVAAMTFGPKKVIVVVGINKICRDEEDAFNRLASIAAPKNNMRLNTINPCTKTGNCMNCLSKGRICRVYSVFKRKPSKTDMTVVVIGQSMGY